MPFDGSGNFVRIYNWVTDKLNNIDITSSREDAEDDGFAAGLTNCLTRDGQGIPTSPLTWGQKLTLNQGLSVGNQPAFNAQLSNFNNLPSGTNNVVLDRVNFNPGSGYSNGTGFFTAPVAGNYVFSALLVLQNNAGVPVTFNTAYFSKNNNTILGANTFFLPGISPNTTLSPSPSNFPVCASGSVILSLGLSETVSLKVACTGGALQATNLSSFFGYMLG